MPDVVKKPELIHHVALRASRHSFDIRDAVEDLLRSRGMNARQSSKEATRLQIPVELAIDQHLSTFSGRQLVTYFQRDPRRPHRARPLVDAGKFRFTALIQAELITMPPRKFEVLLGNLFVGLEFSDIAVTPMTSDGGVDFVGKVGLGRQPPTPGAITGPSPLHEQSVYFFGQAKRYTMTHPVETSEIDALVGATRSLARGGGTAVKDRMITALQGWGWQVNAPLIPMFATTGWFRSSIPGYARTQGYSIFDGEQLAQRVAASTVRIRTIREARRAIRRLIDRPFDHVTWLG